MKLVLALLALAIVGGGAVHVVHGLQSERLTIALSQRATQLRLGGDGKRSISYLKRYVQQVPNDIDAMAELSILLRDNAKSANDLLEALLLMERVVAIDAERHETRRELIELLLAFGRGDAAVEHLELLNRDFPNDGLVQIMFGRVREMQGAIDEAIEYYTRAIEYSPSIVDGYERLALLNPLIAEELFDSMISSNPEHPDAFVVRARYWRRSGNLVRSASDIEASLRLDPVNLDALLLATDLVSSGCKSIDGPSIERKLLGLQREGARDLRVYHALCQMKVLSGDSQAGIGWLRKGLKVDADNIDLHLHLAIELLNAKQDAAAEREIVILVKRGIASPLEDYLFGRLYFSRGDYFRAETRLHSALAGAAMGTLFRTESQLWLARCCGRVHDTAGELEAYHQAIKSRGFSHGYNSMQVVSHLVARLSGRNQANAADQLLQAVESRGDIDLPNEYYAFASTLASTAGDDSRALQLAKHNVTLHPTDARAHLILGRLLSRTGQPDEAERALRRAVSLDSQNLDAWGAFVEHLSRVEKIEAAVVAISKARQSLSPAEAPLVLAQCYEMIGLKVRAEREYLIALSLHPNDESTLLSVAQFYIRAARARRARPLLSRIIDGRIADVSDATRVWAKQQMRQLQP